MTDGVEVTSRGRYLPSAFDVDGPAVTSVCSALLRCRARRGARPATSCARPRRRPRRLRLRIGAPPAAAGEAAQPTVRLPVALRENARRLDQAPRELPPPPPGAARGPVDRRGAGIRGDRRVAGRGAGERP